LLYINNEELTPIEKNSFKEIEISRNEIINVDVIKYLEYIKGEFINMINQEIKKLQKGQVDQKEEKYENYLLRKLKKDEKIENIDKLMIKYNIKEEYIINLIKETKNIYFLEKFHKRERKMSKLRDPEGSILHNKRVF
jgi:hypothetical protein